MNRTSTALAVSLLLLLAQSCLAPSSPDEGEDALSILFAGDVLLDRGVRPIAEHRGVAHLFAKVAPYFRRADAVVVNLECPLTDSLSPVNKQFVFRADARWAADLHRSGITHAALANNHSVDQGSTGLRATWHHLTDAHIVPLGYGPSTAAQLAPALIAKGRLQVALFNALDFPLENWFRAEGQPDISRPTANELCAAVRLYHAENPKTRIVVILHWGTEFQPMPSIHQRRLAARLAEAGADAIIGHHPHVLQPIDTIANTLVFYSLGNFVFDQRPPQTRQSMMVRLRFRPSAPLEYDTIPIRIRQCRPVPVR
ncbi:MAG: CapA family protein [Bacteroidaceae bacterium]|nr:CapA family protein [Bacteroidaceae bacterium]